MIAFIAFSSLYIFFLLWCKYYWNQISAPTDARAVAIRFSIIVPVRNEASNIGQIIQDLQAQNYPKSLFEVLVVDDSSEDETLLLARQAFQISDLNYQLLMLEEFGKTGKKSAITAGVYNANYEVILSTDGDCRLPTNWLAAYASKYANTSLQMVTGPVRMLANNLFTRLQQIEFSGLIGIGAASLQAKRPNMCNGANLSYKKDAFIEVGGYEGNFQVASGDDEFLLQKIFNLYPESVAFLKDPRAIVSTPAKPTIGALVNQRLRWSSKWKFHQSWHIKSMAILVFVNYLSLFWALITVIDGDGSWWLFVTVMTFRATVLALYEIPIARFFNIRNAPFFSFCMEIIYPFVVIFLGIASIFGHYSWKGRRYS